ncbi:hypothetical protein MLD38_009162 [Melastoma candidum]|uniref:Uncharacterized protein n=1 Tax=Melastoma candidum TaxID=119954 RepID=A0ACB9RW43_9MYRT|nr:hypothetical protein MLD38_009162 [Melastoma candidum]
MEANLRGFCREFMIKLTPNFRSFLLKGDEMKRSSDIALGFFRVKGVFGEFRDMGLLMTESAATSLIRSLGNVGMVEELLWVWRKMKVNGIVPSLYTYNFLLNGFVNSMFIESAEKVFEVMEGGSIVPDTSSDQWALQAWEAGGGNFFRNAGGQRLAVNPTMYSCLIDGHGKAGRVDEAEKLFEKMVEMGCTRDAYCYNVLIDAYAKHGKIDDA